MECTSEKKFKSDSEQDGVLDSNAIVLLSPTSDHSDKRSDPVVLERELAHELAASKQATNVPSETTISFEEALERELEFQKRRKIAMLQASIDSGSLFTPSQVLRPKPSLTGIKRKVVSENLPEKEPYGSQDQRPPKQLQALRARMQRLQNNRPSMQQLQHQNPPQWLNGRWLPTQGLNCRPPFPQHKQNQPHLLRHSMGKQLSHRQSENLQEPPNVIASFWCNICKVSCSNALNLNFHYLGRKHKAKFEEVFGSKNTRLNENEVNESKNNEIVWCKECNVPCMKGASWAQHCAGKKHVARLLASQSLDGASGHTISGKAAV
ncbi:uncharacterized protein [Elaeis guineensis]|nr:uncharacterized protein LOC105032242 isoform X2 [Elaeis guineensis]XP_010904929.1 uncharacterized protein LOC105032242 isoform X2 [Elaeis guineensis]